MTSELPGTTETCMQEKDMQKYMVVVHTVRCRRVVVSGAGRKSRLC